MAKFTCLMTRKEVDKKTASPPHETRTDFLNIFHVLNSIEKHLNEDSG